MPWKCGREFRIIFFIPASPLVSQIGKNSFFLVSSMIWVGDIGSSSPLGSSRISGCSPRGFSSSPIVKERISQSPKKKYG